MPRGDGTGPMGMGPMTGRGAGFCAGFAAPGYMNWGAGYGGGFGRGRGYRRMYYLTGMPGWSRPGYYAYGGAYVPAVNGAYAPAADEKEYLNNQVEALENQLQQVKNRLKVLNGENE